MVNNAYLEEMEKTSFRNLVEFYKEELRSLEDGSLKLKDVSHNLKRKFKVRGVLIIKQGGGGKLPILTDEAKEILYENEN